MNTLNKKQHAHTTNKQQQQNKTKLAFRNKHIELKKGKKESWFLSHLTIFIWRGMTMIVFYIYII